MPLFSRFARPGLLVGLVRRSVLDGTLAMVGFATDRSDDDDGVGRTTAHTAGRPSGIGRPSGTGRPSGSEGRGLGDPTIVRQLTLLTMMLQTGELSSAEYATAKRRLLAP